MGTATQPMLHAALQPNLKQASPLRLGLFRLPTVEIWLLLGVNGQLSSLEGLGRGWGGGREEGSKLLTARQVPTGEGGGASQSNPEWKHT